MEAVVISSSSLNGQNVFLEFIPTGETEHISLGYQTLPYTFVPGSLSPPKSKVGTIIIHYSGTQCTYDINVPDIPPTPTPSITPTLTPTPLPTPTPTPTCVTAPSVSATTLAGSGMTLSSFVFGNLNDGIVSVSGFTVPPNIAGTTYQWYSGATNITPTGNTQLISFNLGSYPNPFSINFVATSPFGCGTLQTITIVPFLNAFINVLNTTPDSGSNDGTVTFEVVGGYPPPPYGSSETFFVYDFPNFVTINNNVSHTFGGYASGSYSLVGSGYFYGDNPSTGFTIGFDPCANPANVPTAGLYDSVGGTVCEGTSQIMIIDTNGTSYDLYSPSGLYASNVGPCSPCYEYYFADASTNGTWTLITYLGSCSASTTYNLTVLLAPTIDWYLVQSPTIGNADGQVRMGASNTSYIQNDYDFGFTFGPPYIKSFLPQGTWGFYPTNNCSSNYVPINFVECATPPVVNLSANTLTVCSGSSLVLAAFGGDIYTFLKLDNGTPTFITTVAGDPITGATVVVTSSATPGVTNGEYACQVTDSSGCQNYETINISVIIC